MTDTTTTTDSLPVANLRASKRQQAQARRADVARLTKAPASKRQQATARKAAALADVAAATADLVSKADKPTRKTPTRSAKPKLRWEGNVAKADGKEVGRQIEQHDGTFWAQVKNEDGKPEVLKKGVSGGRAYSIITRFYHYGERP